MKKALLFILSVPLLFGQIPQGSRVLSGSLDVSNGILVPPKGADLPGTCADGEFFIKTSATSGQRLYLCESGTWVAQGGSGASLTDLQVSKTSSTVATIGAGRSQWNGVVNVNASAETVSNPTAVTGTVWFTRGASTIHANHDLTALTPSAGITAQAGTGYAAGEIPLGYCTVVNNAFDTCTDVRAFLGIDGYLAGDGLNLSGNTFSLADDATRFSSGTTVPGSCSGWGHFFFDTDAADGAELNYCDGVSLVYRQVVGGSTTPGSLPGYDRILIDDQFIAPAYSGGVVTSNYRWTAQNVNGGTPAGVAVSIVGTHGRVSITSGTVAGDTLVLSTNEGNRTFGNMHNGTTGSWGTWRTQVRGRVLTTLDNLGARVGGLCQGQAVVPGTDYIMFRFDTNNAAKESGQSNDATNWRLVARKASATVSVDTGVAVDLNDHTFELRISAADNVLHGYIDGVDVAQIASANLPTTNLYLCPASVAYNGTNASAFELDNYLFTMGPVGDFNQVSLGSTGPAGPTGPQGPQGEAGTGDVTAAAPFGTDNRLIKSDGTAKGVQATGVAVDDSNNVSAPGTMTALGYISAGGSVGGYLELAQGTATSPSANSVIRIAPTSIATAYTITEPSAVGSTGVVKVSVSGTVATLSHAALAAGDLPAASDTAVGGVELATAAETTTGTDGTRAVTPDGLAGSDFGKDVLMAEVIADATALTTGDGKLYIPVPAKLNGWLAVGVSAHVGAAVSSSGAVNVDIANCAAVATGIRCSGTVTDLLSTNLTVDANEDGSETAAAAAVIDTANDDLATGAWLRVDIDGAGTGTQGLYIVITVQKP
jgi:hypothetical protein